MNKSHETKFIVKAKVECIFEKHHRNRNAFELIFCEFTATSKKIRFPCKGHVEDAKEMLSHIVQYYLQIRMRQSIRQEKAEITKERVLKRKAAKLCDT